MAVTSKLYAKFPLNLGGGDTGTDVSTDLLSDNLRLTLHTSTYTPNQTTNETKSDATNELSTANGYTALGTLLSTKVYSQASLVTTFGAANITWTTTGAVTFRHGVLWNDSGTAPVDPLIGYVDTGGDQTANGTDIVFQWTGGNIFTFTVA